MLAQAMGCTQPNTTGEINLTDEGSREQRKYLPYFSPLSQSVMSSCLSRRRRTSAASSSVADPPGPLFGCAVSCSRAPGRTSPSPVAHAYPTRPRSLAVVSPTKCFKYNV